MNISDATGCTETGLCTTDREKDSQASDSAIGAPRRPAQRTANGGAQPMTSSSTHAALRENGRLVRRRSFHDMFSALTAESVAGCAPRVRSTPTAQGTRGRANTAPRSSNATTLDYASSAETNTKRNSRYLSKHSSAVVSEKTSALPVEIGSLEMSGCHYSRQEKQSPITEVGWAAFGAETRTTGAAEFTGRCNGQGALGAGAAKDTGASSPGKMSYLRPLAGSCYFDGCSKMTVFRCRRCREAFYCSRGHQRAHWGKHRHFCKEGIGSPRPRLAHLALWPLRTQLSAPQRSQGKAVGWADSTPSRSRKAKSDQPVHRSPGNSDSEAGACGANATGNVRFASAGDPPTVANPADNTFVSGSGGGQALGVSTDFRRQNNRWGDRLGGKIFSTGATVNASAMTAAGAVGATRVTRDLHHTGVRSTRGGTSWTVPGITRSPAGGSAEVWPSSAGIAFGGSGGTIAEAAAAAARKREERVAITGIPAPASRSAGGLDGMLSASRLSQADVDILAEMGFGHQHASEALRICDNNVERAAEWLLSGADGEDHDTSLGVGSDTNGEMRAYGPHRNPDAYDHGGSRSDAWGGVTELQTVTGGTLIGGDLNGDIDDDLITNTDATDCGQGLDMREFWSSDAVRIGVESSSVNEYGVAEDGDDSGGWKREASFREDERGAHECEMKEGEQDDSRDLVTSYEDCVGGAPADVVVFYRHPGSHSSDTVATATVAPDSCESALASPAGGIASLESRGSVGGEIASAVASAASSREGHMSVTPLAVSAATFTPAPGSDWLAAIADEFDRKAASSGEDGDKRARAEAVLTLVVRPLPSTAPASLDSDSSRGGGTDERHDPSHDTEHVLDLHWDEAEALAWRFQEAKRSREGTVGLRASTSTVETSLFLDSGALPLPQAPPPLSPLSPPPSSRSNRQIGFTPERSRQPRPSSPLPSWRRKNKVGRLIAAMLQRRVDGGYEASTLADSALHDGFITVAARTRERPRGRSLPKWESFRAESSAASAACRRQLPVGSALSKFGSEVNRLPQAWSCQACTFFNEDAVFRTVCEMCRTERPRGRMIPTDEVGWELGVQPSELDGGGTGWAERAREGEGGGAPDGTTSTLYAQRSMRTSAVELNNDDYASRDVPASDVVRMEVKDRVATFGDDVEVGDVESIALGGQVPINRGGRKIDVPHDDGAVDGILGGVSPGGAFPSPLLPIRGTALSSVDWEEGADWNGLGSATFGDSPVDLSSHQSAFDFD